MTDDRWGLNWIVSLSSRRLLRVSAWKIVTGCVSRGKFWINCGEQNVENWGKQKFLIDSHRNCLIRHNFIGHNYTNSHNLAHLNAKIPVDQVPWPSNQFRLSINHRWNRIENSKSQTRLLHNSKLHFHSRSTAVFSIFHSNDANENWRAAEICIQIRKKCENFLCSHIKMISDNFCRLEQK